MTHDDCTTLLGGWTGYELAEVTETDAGLVLDLRPVPGRLMFCARCGLESRLVHDTVERYVRDLPVFEHQVMLKVHRQRIKCEMCGPSLEHLSWLDRYSRVTTRLAESVARLCSFSTILDACRWYSLTWDQVKRIHKNHLAATLGPVDLTGVRMIAMDEFAIHKGHRYATVIADPITRRVLWIGEGRSRESIRSFFELLGPSGCKKIRVAVMDMWPAYTEETLHHCPKAQIVYDGFHVHAKFGREVTDKVRVAEAKQYEKTNPQYRVIKKSKWLLLSKPTSLNDQQQHRLEELLDANENLMIVHVLGEDLKRLWQIRNTNQARLFLNGWIHRAHASGISHLIKFALLLKRHYTGIINHAKHPLNTGFLEGINNKIKVIKRRAYGYRDPNYFFLLIRAAFPGKTG